MQPGPHPIAKGAESRVADALMTRTCLRPSRLPWSPPGAKRPGLPVIFPVFWPGRAL